jgi:hypothetical protein
MNDCLYLNAFNKSLNVFKGDGQEVERVQVSYEVRLSSFTKPLVMAGDLVCGTHKPDPE